MRQAVYRLGHRLPVSGVLLRTSGMAFFAGHLTVLIRAGLNIAQSLTVLERATSDEFYKEGVKRAQEIVLRGERLSVAMRAAGCFPPLTLRMVAIGENTGSLDNQLSYLADEYRQRAEHMIASLSEIIKPVVILFAGVFFIFVIVVLLLPVYDLIRQSMTIG
jgi:general secretion pathway protein F/type IV pilus assembly protein PilC